MEEKEKKTGARVIQSFGSMSNPIENVTGPVF